MLGGGIRSQAQGEKPIQLSEGKEAGVGSSPCSSPVQVCLSSSPLGKSMRWVSHAYSQPRLPHRYGESGQQPL